MKTKNKSKIYVMGTIIVCLSALLCFLIYITFIADSDYRKMGYSYKEINLIHQYEIEESVTTYNKSLIYALNSKEFMAKNIEYYVLFNSQMDLTRIINAIAENYSIDNVKQMRTYLSDEDLSELPNYEVISNLKNFKAIYEKGYTIDKAIYLTNNLPNDSLTKFLSVVVLTKPENYLTYLDNGYDDDVICLIVNELGEDGFNNLAHMRHFDKIYELVISTNFNIDLLPRYLMYLASHKSATALNAIAYVNKDKDYTAASDIDYSAFYDKKSSNVDSNENTILVNKTHILVKSYIPATLQELNANYRYNNQMLKTEAAEAFVQLADACQQETGFNILAYTNYQSYASNEAAYNQALIDSYNDEAKVDKYMLKAGSNEHQTGLATDIAIKGSSPDKLEDTAAYLWLQENSAEYGYVKRYPIDKEFLTGVRNNNYHFRYVGTEVAAIMTFYNWCLEEYYFVFIAD